MMELKPCPFCGGRGKISFKDYRFGGQNFKGDKKISYRVQIICRKCHGRGKPIVTPLLINPNPYRTSYYLADTKSRSYVSLINNDVVEKEDIAFRPFVEEAIEAWNRRVTDGTERKAD